MTVVTRKYLRVSAFAAAGAVGLFWDGDLSPRADTGFVSTANAVIGRPVTPVSYAGVTRRTTVGVGAPGVGAPGVGVGRRASASTAVGQSTASGGSDVWERI